MPFRTLQFHYVWIQGEEDRRIKVLSNLMVDMHHYLPEIEILEELGVTELVYYPVLEKILEENDTLEDMNCCYPQRYPRSDSETYYKRRYFCFY